MPRPFSAAASGSSSGSAYGAQPPHGEMGDGQQHHEADDVLDATRRHGALEPEPHVHIGERDQQHREPQHEDLGPAASTWHRHLRFRNAAERRIIRRRDAAHRRTPRRRAGRHLVLADGDTDGAATTDTPSARRPRAVGRDGRLGRRGRLGLLAGLGRRSRCGLLRHPVVTAAVGGLAHVGLGLQLADDVVGVAQAVAAVIVPWTICSSCGGTCASVRELREYTLDRLTPATRWLTPRKIVTCPWLVPDVVLVLGVLPGPVAAADHHRGQHDQRHRHDRPAPPAPARAVPAAGLAGGPVVRLVVLLARHRASRPARSAARPA